MPAPEVQKSWTRQEAAVFDAEVRLRNRRLLLDAFQITAVFLAVLALATLFYRRHNYLYAELCLWAAAGTFVWVAIRHWLLFASWNSARLIRKDLGDPL